MEPYEIEQELRPELLPGEILVWVGQPRKGIFLKKSDAVMIPFSIMWGGFAIFWEAMVIMSGGPFFFKLWGIPFVLVGLYLIFGRFFYDAFVRSQTLYGMTKDRIIIKSGLRFRSVKSFDIRQLGELSVERKSDGSGTILLGPAAALAPGRWSAGPSTQPPQLEFIEDVDKVYGWILEIKKKR